MERAINAMKEKITDLLSLNETWDCELKTTEKYVWLKDGDKFRVSIEDMVIHFKSREVEFYLPIYMVKAIEVSSGWGIFLHLI